MRTWLILIIGGLLATASAGCKDDTVSPVDRTPPAAPRGVYSVTGDRQVALYWLANTEGDVSGYRVYQSDCGGTGCLYSRVGSTTNTSFTVSGLTNGVTRFFAVAAVDLHGNESDLSYETVYDTPRPAGTGAVVANYRLGSSGAGWDFSGAVAVASSSPAADIAYYVDTLGTRLIYALDPLTNIQDAGYTANLDAVNYAPAGGWSPTGSVEVIPTHSYVVWTADNHFAKFRVTNANNAFVVFDWAYQTDPGNGELRARPARNPALAFKPPVPEK
jgi:hypothetical protein